MSNKFLINENSLRDIANAIRTKLGTSESYTPSEMGAAIMNIQTVTPTADMNEYPLRPSTVYEATRPSDWLKMPTPSTEEIYLLWDMGFGSTSISNFYLGWRYGCKIEVGNLENDVFVPVSKYTITKTGTSSAKIEFTCDTADFTHSCSMGKQALVKVSGTQSNSTITKLSAGYNAYSGTIYFRYVDLYMNTPSITDYSSAFFNAFGIEYIRFRNNCTSRATSFSQTFTQCNNLKCIDGLDISNATNTVQVIYSCPKLLAVPVTMDFSKSTDTYRIFASCPLLKYIPKIIAPLSKRMAYLIQNGYSVKELYIDLPLASDPDSYTLQALEHLQKITIRLPESETKYLYIQASRLNEIVLLPSSDTYKGINITIDAGHSNWKCTISHDALVDFFYQLPTIPATKNITIKNCAYANTLTDNEKAIATNKGWNLITA